MIHEPRLRLYSLLDDGQSPRWHYMVANEDKKHYCWSSTYASYLATKIGGKILNLDTNKQEMPSFGACPHCQKQSLELCGGNRGSFPDDIDAICCVKCDSVFTIMDILKRTNAYATNADLD